MRWRYGMRMIVIKGRLELIGQSGQALAAADEVDIARKTQAYKNIAQCCRLRGECYSLAGMRSKARAALQHALAVGLRISCPALIWPVYMSLAAVDVEEGNLDAARVHYRSAADLLKQVADGLSDLPFGNPS